MGKRAQNGSRPHTNGTNGSTKAAREWPDERRAPGGDICRMAAVRIRTQAGAVADTIDIREPVGIEIEYDVIAPGYLVRPDFGIWSEDGVRIFISFDLDPSWRGRRRPAGRYRSTGWIPANFLAEGHFLIDAAINVTEPEINQAFEQSVVGFQIVDSMEGDSARGVAT